ncbi:hypothetical protein SynA1825c_02563 [Synechococcus sp. A18-25c]|nr:hypothetical protein SynA1825c_02563 [Synechococcus sp. A18-25c]
MNCGIAQVVVSPTMSIATIISVNVKPLDCLIIFLVYFMGRWCSEV